jgi:hypothetical protein
MPTFLLAIVLLGAWIVLAVPMGLTAPAVHLLVAASAILFVRGWALAR